MGYRYEPYPESVEKARFLAERKPPVVIYRGGNEPVVVMTHAYFWLGKWDIEPFIWNWSLDGDDSEACVQALAKWIDRLPSNLKYIASISEVTSQLVVASAQWTQDAQTALDEANNRGYPFIYTYAGAFELWEEYPLPTILS